MNTPLRRLSARLLAILTLLGLGVLVVVQPDAVATARGDAPKAAAIDFNRQGRFCRRRNRRQ